ncbi:MAG: nuclear transport factor 2 family protein [Acidobacteriota bacterium]|nr:nuclear transport factor 2 family protein [Acidobacteriota bacterium]
MENLINKFTAARPNTFSPGPILLLFMLLLPTSWAHAQSKNGSPASKELYDRIASLDAALFEAYNACHLDKVGTFFTEDLEFYHEKGGLTLTRNGSLEIMRKNLCGGGNRVRRELVQGSLEVFPISNYGAVQTGEHRFYLTPQGQKEKLDGIGRFVMLWQKKDGAWRISRVVSYGFRPPE